MTEGHLSDTQIIEQFEQEATRDAAFKQLVVKYQEKLYWLIRRMVNDHEDANDVLQNVFVKVWKNLSKFRRDSELYTWLYRIATNETLSFLKKQKRRMTDELDDHVSADALTVGNDAGFSGGEIQRKLHSAINKLPDKQRLVFNLRYFEEMPYNEMSETLGTSVGALKASYHLAVKKIEKNIMLPD